MPDAYEALFQLDASDPADALLDDDRDGLANAAEAALGTDPWVTDTDRDGVPDNTDADPVSRLVLDWGEPLYTYGNQYFYTGPPWWLGAWKDGGSWTAAPTAWLAEATPASLLIALDRTLLTNDLHFESAYSGIPGAALFLDLDDTNGQPVLASLFGNLLSGSNLARSTNFLLPLAKHPEAALIRLRHATGTVTVLETRLYEPPQPLSPANSAAQLPLDLLSSSASDVSAPAATTETLAPANPYMRAKAFPGTHLDSRVIHVDAQRGSDTLDGRARTKAGTHGPKRTLAGGLSAAVAGDVIVVAPGTYAAVDFRTADVDVFFGDAVIQ